MIPIYRTDPYQSECVSLIDRVLLDPTNKQQTIFLREALFMEGGGQPMDFGQILVEGNELPLLKIIKEKGNTGYVVPSNFECVKGMSAKCILDFNRRLKIMRLHSAQHALAGSIRLIRESILTGGMKITEDANYCKVIYPTSSDLSELELDKGLALTQDFIKNSNKIFSESVSSETAAIEKYGLVYRPTIASNSLKGNIRLIVIENLDANACGGTHVRELSEIGELKIIDVKAIDQGKEIMFSVL